MAPGSHIEARHSGTRSVWSDAKSYDHTPPASIHSVRSIRAPASRGLLPPGVEYVNADLIAQRLTGRIELAEIDRLVAARESFAVETTLAPRAFEKRIAQWKAAGYEVVLFFYLSEPEQSVRRVRQRVLNGGHDVPEDVIRRRYEEGLRNFFGRYRPLADAWQFLDNSDIETRLVASSSIIGGERIGDPSLWSKLEARYAL